MSALALPIPTSLERRSSGLVMPRRRKLVVRNFDITVGSIESVPREWREALFGDRPRLAGLRGKVRGLGFFETAIQGFSQTWQAKVLDHVDGHASLSAPTNLYLALTTVAVTETDTGATITEAGYTGYGRKTVAAADWAAATAAAPSVGATNTAETFAACTASSSTVIGWALCDSTTTGAGNIVTGGTCTSVVISSTQTPPTIASGALSNTLN